MVEEYLPRGIRRSVQTLTKDQMNVISRSGHYTTLASRALDGRRIKFLDWSEPGQWWYFNMPQRNQDITVII